MENQRVTKNISMGEPISDLRELVRLAQEKKSVIVLLGWDYYVRPAAFMVHWSVANIARLKIYYSIKSNN